LPFKKLEDLHFGNFYTERSKPEDPALIYYDQKITYEEMHHNIRQYVTYLQQAGLKAGDVIALSCYNTPEFIYSYFAITQLGAVVVPLNLMLTLEEIVFIIRDSNAKAMFIHENILTKLKSEPAALKAGLGFEHVFTLGSELTSVIHSLEPSDFPDPDPKSVSTLLYTSGTTGKPKGAMLSHRNLMANTASCMEALHHKAEDVFVCVLPMFHTFGFTTSVLLPLFAGSSIVIHEAFHPKEIMQSLVQNKITVFCGVPAMFVVLAQALREGKAAFPDLRLAVSGGSPLPVEILNLFVHHYNIPLMEGYGLTEASPVVCFNPLHGEKKPGSVGLPLAGVEVRIIDDKEQTLEPNEVGEIIVRGPNVMLGYLHLPEATAETIVDGWLHTGDMGYIDHEGYVYIVDRKKDMIITRGLNVYPREIEEVLYQHPGVLEAAVIGVPDEVKGEVIKAFVVAKEEESLNRRSILDFLKPKLASYKLPRHVEVVDHLPKNAAGKILKKELKRKRD
jgi:long-chain acyl-CoA synthetase